MPTIGYLFRMRRALLATSRIIASAIPANYLNPWMGQEPLGKSFGFPIWQKVHWHPLFEVDQDRAKGNPSPKREVIHSQHARRRVRGLLGSMEKPKERVGTGGEAHTCSQALSCFPTQRKADESKDIRESCGAPGVGSHHSWEAFREDLTLTFLIRAEKAAYMQFQVDRTAHPGQIGDVSHRARVNPRRQLSAEGTGCFWRNGRHHGGNRRVRGVQEL